MKKEIVTFDETGIPIVNVGEILTFRKNVCSGRWQWRILVQAIQVFRIEDTWSLFDVETNGCYDAETKMSKYVHWLVENKYVKILPSREVTIYLDSDPDNDCLTITNTEIKDWNEHD